MNDYNIATVTFVKERDPPWAAKRKASTDLPACMYIPINTDPPTYERSAA